MTDEKIKPIFDKDLGLCDPECPYLSPWDHPYWHHSAWCWHLMGNLSWYDYWRAKCMTSKPKVRLKNMKGSGNKFDEFNSRINKE